MASLAVTLAEAGGRDVGKIPASQGGEMSEERERPRPHGDPLRNVVEENQAQQQSDAPPDASIEAGRGGIVQETDRDDPRGSTANGIPAFDEDAGEERRRQYAEGASLVSETD